MSEQKHQPSDIDLSNGNDSNGGEGQTAQAAPSAAAPDEGAAPSSEAPRPDPPSPEEQLAALEAEKDDLRDRMLRLAADFDNWKKRARKEKDDGEARVKEGVLRDFLDIVDNLERALASIGEGKEGEAKSIRDGVDLVLRQFRSKLERYQVKAIESVGQAFDPRFHEAISQVPSPTAKPGSVAHELQKGYLIGDRLLRPSMVVVASAAAPAPADEAADGQGSSTAKGEGED
jgi:molecular chaperone GrpE